MGMPRFKPKFQNKQCVAGQATGSLLRLACVAWLATAWFGQVEASSQRATSGRASHPAFVSSTPEQQGMDSGRLVQAVDFFLANRGDYDIHNMAITHNGIPVVDGSFYPYQPGQLHDIKSVTKAVTSTLIGIAIEMDYIDSVDERMVDFFADRTIANLDDRKGRITIEHLLTMSSGFAWESGGLWEASEDWVGYVLDRPMAHEPGTEWEYIGGNTHLLSAIITQTTGRSAHDFAKEYLFEPLGIKHSLWLTDPSGVFTQGDGGLSLLPHDTAKIGQLMLQNGEWQGRTILPLGWVSAAISGSPAAPGFGYNWHNGFLGSWWFFGMHGSWGQRLLICPRLELVVFLSGGGGINNVIDDLYYDAVETYVIPAVVSSGPIPEDPAEMALLSAALETATMPIQQGFPPAPLPAIANQISGRSFVLQENRLGLLSATFVFLGDDEVRLQVTTNSRGFEVSYFEWRVGLDGRERFARGRHGHLTAGVGSWEDQQTLVTHVDELGYVNQYSIRAVFVGDEVEITAQLANLSAQPEPITVQGHLED